MPTCPECQNFLMTPGRCPRDKKVLLDDAEAKKRGIAGRVADRYLVQRMIGEGGMGSVYLALHETLQRKVAIKILRREGQMEEQAAARFRREAKAASSVTHRHVVSIMDFGELLDGSAYYVMEHLDGKSLADAIDKEAPFPLERALSIAVQITKGLKAAHDKGVTHRDLKPDNVFLVANQELPDFVKILDFGVAKIASDSQKLTQTGMVLGTPDYMAPEQAIGKPTDLRADIYALGILLYEMVTGALPFQGQTFMEVLSQHIYHPPPLLSERFPALKLPPVLDEVIQKALKKKPENRYQTMDEVLTALLAIPAGNAVAKTLDLSQALPAIARRPATGAEGPLSRRGPSLSEGPLSARGAALSVENTVSRRGPSHAEGAPRRPAPPPPPQPTLPEEDELTHTANPESYDSFEDTRMRRGELAAPPATIGAEETLERTVEGVRRKLQELTGAPAPAVDDEIGKTSVYIPSSPSSPAMAPTSAVPLPRPEPRPAPPPRRPTTPPREAEEVRPARAPKASAPPEPVVPSLRLPPVADPPKGASALPVGLLAVGAALASFFLVAAILFLLFRGS